MSGWWSLKTFLEALQCYKSYFLFGGIMPIRDIVLFDQAFIFLRSLKFFAYILLSVVLPYCRFCKYYCKNQLFINDN